jgi:hypothetical protein
LINAESESGAESVNEVDDEDEDEELNEENINIDLFSSSVMRLIENYDNLLEIRNTIFRRAKNFLEKTYSDEIVSLFEDFMKSQQADTGKNKINAPHAERAGDSFSSGVSGGGSVTGGGIEL